MRLDAALQGNLEQFMEDELALAEAAVTLGRRRAAEGMKFALRAETRSELGNRVANAWRSKIYPGTGDSLSTAGLIWTNADNLVAAFAEGTPIKSNSGHFLAVPTEDVRRLKYKRKRVTPENWPEHRFGPLRFVARNGKPPLLVVDNQRQTKGKNSRSGYALSRSKKALETGHGLSTVVMFFLVPQVRLGKRIDPDAIIEDWAGREVRLIDQAFEELGNSPRFRRMQSRGRLK
ncbi:MAG: hypothetical protein CML66_25885 [Rhodobacteraceae bacterium]|nr:hypothetical protein [Paracoccaceae bacterium]MAY44645.1 hypothetical protein [Paracoccaceae bacterium]